MLEPARLAPSSEAEAPVSGPGQTTAPRLVTEGIVKAWRKRGRVLDGVDMALVPGQLALLSGQNGAGKTTLLRILAGVITPDSGRVVLDGLEPLSHRRAYQARIGYLSAQQGTLYARLTAAQHLDYWARIAMIPRAQRNEAIARATSLFAVEELASQRVDRLSMGQRQRVRLAMTFLHNPKLILLDEPRNSLDSDATALLLSAIASYAASGATTIWCVPTGDEGDVPFGVSYVLEQGRLVQR
jgi:ABC-type multidrug transport system ATPase subunit